MQSYIEEREREVAEREAAWRAELSCRECSAAARSSCLILGSFCCLFCCKPVATSALGTENIIWNILGRNKIVLTDFILIGIDTIVLHVDVFTACTFTRIDAIFFHVEITRELRAATAWRLLLPGPAWNSRRLELLLLAEAAGSAAAAWRG